MPAKKKRSKRTGATRHTEEKSSGLTWVIMGLLVGSFVAFLVYLDKMPTQDGKNVSQESEQNKSTSQARENKPKPPEHQFDFYTVLPDREVKVNDLDDEATENKSNYQQVNNTIAKTTPQSSSLYQLQVGAFKALEKADAMKARLAFMGVESNIQVIQTNGQKMYRVRVGPSTDAQKIEQIRAQLKSQNINTFMQKL